MLERWREEKEEREPGFAWVRSLRPPPNPLGGAQSMCLRGHERPVNSVAVSPDGRRIVSGASDLKVRIWDAETLECVEIIGGRRDVEAIAGGAEQYPFRALVRGGETVIEGAATGREVAQFAVSLREIATYPSGRIWAGARVQGSYLALIKLEGEPEAARY